MCHSLLKNATGNGTQAVPYAKTQQGTAHRPFPTNIFLIFLLGAVSFVLRQPLFSFAQAADCYSFSDSALMQRRQTHLS